MPKCYGKIWLNRQFFQLSIFTLFNSEILSFWHFSRLGIEVIFCFLLNIIIPRCFFWKEFCTITINKRHNFANEWRNIGNLDEMIFLTLLRNWQNMTWLHFSLKFCSPLSLALPWCVWNDSWWGSACKDGAFLPAETSTLSWPCLWANFREPQQRERPS